VKTVTQRQSVFDQSHYVRLIQARGVTIRSVIAKLKPALGLSTSLDAGCGLGFFSQILRECGLDACAFDGRLENVEEARRRFPHIRFEQGDIQTADILRLGQFDLVLCFGLLYHLENPFLAIRHLGLLSRKALLLESMCLPDEKPWTLLREEASLEDQSLTDMAFYASEGCLVKMLYRSGFPAVYRIPALPDHDDFRETVEHTRRRAVLLALHAPIELPGFVLFPEPEASRDPWAKDNTGSTVLLRRIRKFFTKPAHVKYLAVANQTRRVFPKLPIPLRLPFGAWWVAERSALDSELMSHGFESAELTFMEKMLQPGMTVLDVGAHHGLHTLLSSKRVGLEGRVIAFEPSPRERKRLERHLRLNSCKNVRVESFALGSREGESNLFLVGGAEDWCNSLRPPAVSGPTHPVRIEVRRLDDLLAPLHVGRVDFIKLDVEGGELDVLRGASSLLQGSFRPVILAEVYDIRTAPWGYAAREIVQSLARLNYRWFTLSEDGALESISSEWESYDANLVALPAEREQEILKKLGGE